MNYNSPDLYEGDPSRYCLSNERTKGRDANISQRLLAKFLIDSEWLRKKVTYFRIVRATVYGIFMEKSAIFYSAKAGKAVIYVL